MKYYWDKVQLGREQSALSTAEKREKTIQAWIVFSLLI
jgi:hypothetical protein